MRISLFWKIVGSFILGIILPALIIFLTIQEILGDYLTQQIYLGDQVLANQISHQTELFFSNLTDSLSYLSGSGLLLRFQSSLEEEERITIFQQLLKLFEEHQNKFKIFGKKIFENFIILDEEGKIYFTYPYKREYQGLDFSFSPCYQEIVLEGEEKCISNKVFTSLITQKPVIEIGVPIKNEENSLTLIGEVNLESVEIFLRKNFLRQEKGFLMVGSQGTVIFNSSQERKGGFPKKINEIYPGLFEKIKGGERTFLDKKNSPHLFFTFYSFPSQNWYIVFFQDIEKAFFIYYNFKKLFILLICTFLLVVVLVSIFISQRTITPIKRMKELTKEVAKGNLNVTFTTRTGDEIEELSKDLDFMVREIREYQSRLEEAKKVLEVRVRAKTRQLREQAEMLKRENERKTREIRRRLEELERFYRVTIERELKMVELKKEIERLKEELKKYKKGQET